MASRQAADFFRRNRLLEEATAKHEAVADGGELRIKILGVEGPDVLEALLAQWESPPCSDMEDRHDEHRA